MDRTRSSASASGSSPATFDLTNTGPVFTSLIVNTTSDSLFPGAGLLSLPEAIAFANADPRETRTSPSISTVFNTPQTITLTGTQLELSNTSETETITGPAAGVTVSGGGMSRVFQVDAAVTASISGLTITGGTTTGNGGGLANFGTTTLTNCTVSGNSASYHGGGLSSYGTTTLTNCTVSGNSASDGGGGLYNGGTATLTNCTVSGNSAHRQRWRRRPGHGTIQQRHDHADQLHRQRQLRQLRGGGGLSTTAARPR